MRLYIDIDKDFTGHYIKLGVMKKQTPYYSTGKAITAAVIVVVLSIWALYATALPIEAMP